MHKGCSAIRSKLKEESKFKCQTCANEQTGIAEDCPGIELNGHFLEVVEKLCYFGNTIAKGGAAVSAITRVKSGWSKL